MSESPSPDPSAPTPSATGLAPNIAAGLACLFSVVGGAVFLILEKKDRFVRFWAMQSLFLGSLALAFPILVRIAHFAFDFIPFAGTLMMLALGLANATFRIAWFIVYVITVVKAFSSEEWEIPWLGPLARRQLDQTDGPATPPAL